MKDTTLFWLLQQGKCPLMRAITEERRGSGVGEKLGLRASFMGPTGVMRKHRKHLILGSMGQDDPFQLPGVEGLLTRHCFLGKQGSHRVPTVDG